MQCLISAVDMFVMFLMVSTDVPFIKNIIILFMEEISNNDFIPTG